MYVDKLPPYIKSTTHMLDITIMEIFYKRLLMPQGRHIIAMEIENKVYLGLQNRAWSSVYKLPFAVE